MFFLSEFSWGHGFARRVGLIRGEAGKATPGPSRFLLATDARSRRRHTQHPTSFCVGCDLTRMRPRMLRSYSAGDTFQSSPISFECSVYFNVFSLGALAAFAFSIP